MSLGIDTRVKLTGLPTGFKNRKLLGRTGKIVKAENYSGVDFYAVEVDKKPLERGTHTVENITKSRLKVI